MPRTFINRPLLENEIIEAQDRSRSASEAARYLRVDYKTYAKYCRIYGIFERLKNPSGKGIHKARSTVNQGIPLTVILAGDKPSYPNWMLLKRLFNSGYKEQKCEICGFDEKRLIDDKSPLRLHHIDGDMKNHKFDNLQIICFNCYYLTIGNLTGKKQKYFMT